MTAEQIKGNQLIAEFMGYEKTPTGYRRKCTEGIKTKDGYFYSSDEPHSLYISDWNRLMPVVKKCKENHPLAYRHFYIPNALASLDIEMVWQSVVNLITWYYDSRR